VVSSEIHQKHFLSSFRNHFYYDNNKRREKEEKIEKEGYH
jgi:hypothetical protein